MKTLLFNHCQIGESIIQAWERNTRVDVKQHTQILDHITILNISELGLPFTCKTNVPFCVDMGCVVMCICYEVWTKGGLCVCRRKRAWWKNRSECSCTYMRALRTSWPRSAKRWWSRNTWRSSTLSFSIYWMMTKTKVSCRRSSTLISASTGWDKPWPLADFVSICYIWSTLSSYIYAWFPMLWKSVCIDWYETCLCDYFLKVNISSLDVFARPWKAC